MISRTRIFLLVFICLTQGAWAQSFEDQNTCLTTLDDPCLRTGDCSIQGSTWYQEVVVDRADLSDTMGWPGLCDMVHVALVQGQCSPGQSQTNLTVYLSETTYATIDQITGPLICEADAAAAVGDQNGDSMFGDGILENYPNPLTHSTQVRYANPVAGETTIDVYDISGRHVRSLVDAYLPAGMEFATWDGRNSAGIRVPSGLYFLRLQSGPIIRSKRIAVLR